MLGGLGITHPHECGDFELDFGSKLAEGLVFAHLGQHPGSEHYDDGSLFGNHGTLTNMDPATDWVASPYGWALETADTQYINLSSTIDFTSAFSIVGWWKLDTWPAGGYPEAFWGSTGATQFRLFAVAPGPGPLNIRVGLAINSTQGATDVAAGSGWHQFGVTRDASNICKVWLDGREDGSDTVTGTASISRIGASSANRFWLGQHLSCAAWFRALAPSEIQELYRDRYALTRLHRLILPAAAAPSGIIVTPDPVTAAWLVPVSGILKRTSPDPVSAAWGVPSPGIVKRVSPTPTGASWSVVGPALRKSTTPTPATAAWGVTAPTFKKSTILAPATAAWSVVTPSIGAITVELLPVSLAWSVVTPGVHIARVAAGRLHTEPTRQMDVLKIEATRERTSLGVEPTRQIDRITLN